MAEGKPATESFAHGLSGAKIFEISTPISPFWLFSPFFNTSIAIVESLRLSGGTHPSTLPGWAGCSTGAQQELSPTAILTISSELSNMLQDFIYPLRLTISLKLLS